MSLQAFFGHFSTSNSWPTKNGIELWTVNRNRSRSRNRQRRENKLELKLHSSYRL